MVIDEDRKYILTNYRAAKMGGKAVDSDHNTQFMDVNLEMIVEKPERIEIYNFKDDEGQANFKRLTTGTKEFTNCFNDDLPFEEQIQHWEQLLNSYCRKSFKKIRVRRKNSKPVHKSMKSLISKRNLLAKMNKTSENELKLKVISSEIANEEAEEIYNRIVKQFKNLSDDPEQIDLQQM